MQKVPICKVSDSASLNIFYVKVYHLQCKLPCLPIKLNKHAKFIGIVEDFPELFL